MPGLFDNTNHGNMSFGDMLAAQFAPNVYAASVGQQNLQSTYKAYVDNGIPEPYARLFTLNPDAAAKYGAPFLDQGIKQTYNALKGKMGAEGATIGALHSDILKEQMAPKEVAPGSSMYNPFQLDQLGPQTPGLDAATPATSGVQFQNTQGLYDPATLDDLAIRALKMGDQTGLEHAGMGSIGQINRAEVMKRMTVLGKKMGIQPEQISSQIAAFKGLQAANTTMGQVQGRMLPAQVETQQFIQQAVPAVAALKPSNFPKWNQIVQTWKTGTGDPATVEVAARLNSIRNAFSRAISTNPRGPTDADKARFDEIMSKYWSPGQIATGFKVMQSEMVAASKSPEIARKELSVKYGGGVKAPDNIIQQARSAIQKGANRDAVIQHLNQSGYTADGL